MYLVLSALTSSLPIYFIPLLVNRYYDRFLPHFRQFLLLPNRINKFMNLQANCSTPCFNQLCWVVINNWRFASFSFSIAIANSKALGSGTSGSVVFISVFLSSLTHCTFNSWEKSFLYLAKTLLESEIKSSFSSLTALVLYWWLFLNPLMPLYNCFFILMLVSS